MENTRKNFIDSRISKCKLIQVCVGGTLVSPNLEILMKNVWKIENTVIKIIERDKLNVCMFE